MTAPKWPTHRASSVALSIAAWLFAERPEYAHSAYDIATEVGRASHRLESETGFREMLLELLPWTCCEERVERAVQEVYAKTTHQQLKAAVGEPPRAERFTGKSESGNCIPCTRPTNVFLTPGGVEPEEWKTR